MLISLIFFPFINGTMCHESYSIKTANIWCCGVAVYTLSESKQSAELLKGNDVDFGVKIDVKSNVTGNYITVCIISSAFAFGQCEKSELSHTV